MAKEAKRIRITEHTTLGEVLGEAATTPLLLEKNGDLYQLDRVQKQPEDIFAGYDPQAARAGMQAAAGSWSDIDAETLKAYIYRAREEGTRPLNRP
jgi:hypothetical protein